MVHRFHLHRVSEMTVSLAYAQGEMPASPHDQCQDSVFTPCPRSAQPWEGIAWLCWGLQPSTGWAVGSGQEDGGGWRFCKRQVPPMSLGRPGHQPWDRLPGLQG